MARSYRQPVQRDKGKYYDKSNKMYRRRVKLYIIQKLREAEEMLPPQLEEVVHQDSYITGTYSALKDVPHYYLQNPYAKNLPTYSEEKEKMSRK